MKKDTAATEAHNSLTICSCDRGQRMVRARTGGRDVEHRGSLAGDLKRQAMFAVSSPGLIMNFPLAEGGAACAHQQQLERVPFSKGTLPRNDYGPFLGKVARNR